MQLFHLTLSKQHLKLRRQDRMVVRLGIHWNFANTLFSVVVVVVVFFFPGPAGYSYFSTDISLKIFL